MADTKISALAALTTVTDDDLLVVVDAPGGTPVTKKITVANLKAALGAPASSTYTPTWAGTGSAPSVGNGSLVGRYQQFGKLLRVEINLTFGSTTSPGAGGWSFSLPAAAAARTVIQPVGQAWGYDTNPGYYYVGIVGLNAAGVLNIYPEDRTLGSIWQPTVPFTWTTGDILSLSAMVETA